MYVYANMCMGAYTGMYAHIVHVDICTCMYTCIGIHHYYRGPEDLLWIPRSTFLKRLVVVIGWYLREYVTSPNDKQYRFEVYLRCMILWLFMREELAIIEPTAWGWQQVLSGVSVGNTFGLVLRYLQDIPPLHDAFQINASSQTGWQGKRAPQFWPDLRPELLSRSCVWFKTLRGPST